MSLLERENEKKNEMIRISSKWSQLKLSNDQISCAALDALKSLEVYFHLFRLPDLTIRLKVSKATAEKYVDVVPVHGSVACMATRAAYGRIKDNKYLISPGSMRPVRVQVDEQKQRVVQIEKVLAPNLYIPGYKNKNGAKACLGDFGKPPFYVVLPNKMLKDHIDLDKV